MPQCPKNFHNGKRKILVGIQLCHESSRFIFQNLTIDYLRITAGVTPRIH
jgi:hypothetical protein